MSRQPLEWAPEEAAVAGWLVAVANRDRAALQVFYGHTSRRLTAVPVRLPRPWELAEAALQDVFLRSGIVPGVAGRNRKTIRILLSSSNHGFSLPQAEEQ